MLGAGGRGQRIDNAEFRRLIDEAKDRHNITDIVARTTKVIRAGKEKVALCSFHRERSPSMRLSDAKGTYHCFGCGASGDLVTYVMKTEGLRFMDAMRWLGAADLPEVDPDRRRREAEEEAADRVAAIAEAREVWGRGVPAAGTPAEVYARSRGIVAPLPPSIRFARTYAWRDSDSGEVGPDLPAMIGAVTDAAGEIVAIQRIFLADGGRVKARMKRPKLSLGRVKGGAMRLDADRGHADTLIITEGPEDGLSLAQELPTARVWIALGTAMMPAIQYTPEVRRIIVAGQNDDAGRLAAETAGIRLAELGFEVSAMWPEPQFKDWNDQLRGVAR